MVIIRNSLILSEILCLIFVQKVSMEKIKNVRSKRGLLFPASSTLGILIAIAVPLDLPHRNVFMSYNFEANYNLPFKSEHFIPGPLQRLQFDDVNVRRNKKTEERSRKTRNTTFSSLSRTNVYKILENKFSQNINSTGKSCLLRLICETNATILGRYNGVLGDIFRVILTPSLSEHEDFLVEYYEAEFMGAENNCQKYNKNCTISILDLITTEFSTLRSVKNYA